MILIADCGSTKIDWTLINGDRQVASVHSPGMNAAMLSAAEIAQRMRSEAATHFQQFHHEISQVFFYGAGCLTPQISQNVADALTDFLPKAHISVDTDLLGAARALCGHESGIACILGTGANACLFDGEKIVDNISPLGYILGDEGSGAYLGKTLINSVIKRQLPPDLCQAFLSHYNLDVPAIIEHVYRCPAANRFLASFAPFLKDNIHIEEISELVTEAFAQFFRRNVEPLAKGDKSLKANFAGSIAGQFEHQLSLAADASGFRIGKIIKSPIEGLIEYHSTTNR